MIIYIHKLHISCKYYVDGLTVNILSVKPVERANAELGRSGQFEYLTIVIVARYAVR